MYNHHGHTDQYRPDTTRGHAHGWDQYSSFLNLIPMNRQARLRKGMVNFDMGNQGIAGSTIFQAELVTQPVVHLTEPAHSQCRYTHGK